MGDTAQLALMTLLGVSALAGMAWFVRRRMAAFHAEGEAETEAFERSMIETLAGSAMSVGNERFHTKQNGVEVKSVAPGEDEDAETELLAAAPRANKAKEAREKNVSSPNEGAVATPLADEIARKLGAAGAMGGVDGPLMTGDPELIGTVVRLKNGKRLAVLENELRRRDEYQDRVLRQYDGVIVPGPGREPVFAKRFESFIGDLFFPGT